MREYYSSRTGKNNTFKNFDLRMLKKLFSSIYQDFSLKGYFQEHFGFDCVDNGFCAGTLGDNVENAIFLHLRKENLYPIIEKVQDYSEDDLFDIIEFLYDHISLPLEGYYHSWNQCGMHYEKFNKEKGQEEFQENINKILKDYENGFELKNGEILIATEEGMRNIFEAKMPANTPEKVLQKVSIATSKYRSSRSNLEEKRIAIRELADALEFLRGESKKHLLPQDESAIFNIANNFAIRHTNEKQIEKYDKDIWYNWMFYFYLSTIHALTRMINRESQNSTIPRLENAPNPEK